MADRGTNDRRSASTSMRASRSSNPSSARSSAVFADSDQHHHHHHQQQHLHPFMNRYNPSLRSVASRVSLSDQFAATRKEYEFGFDDGTSLFAPSEAEADNDDDDGIVVVDQRDNMAATPHHYRSHYELLCLAEEEADETDVRRAYFRMYDILRSRGRNRGAAAEAYFADVQVAFETLIEARRRDEYDAAVVEGEDGETDVDEDEDEDEDEVGRKRSSQADARYVKRVRRRQQEQQWTEVGVQMDTRRLFSSSQKRRRQELLLPAALSLTHTSTTSLPAISRFLEPRARAVHSAIQGQAKHENTAELDGLHLTPPTLTISSSMLLLPLLAANAPNHHHHHYLPPAGGGQPLHDNLVPETFPKDQPLAWTRCAAYLAPLINARLRQELFLRRRPGRTAAAMAPDAVVELEAAATSLTARASRTLHMTTTDDNDDDNAPLHVEASASVDRPSSLMPAPRGLRLGLAVHKHLPRNRGTIFACIDGGSALLPQHLPPTAEIGYSSSSSSTLGLAAARPFTRQARNGLRRFDDDDDNNDAVLRASNNNNNNSCFSWTVSGAVTPAGAVAGYLRCGRDVSGGGGAARVEAELSTTTGGAAAAVRGLGRVRSLLVGLELGLNNSGSVVLSVYLSQRGVRRLIVPVVVLHVGVQSSLSRLVGGGGRAMCLAALGLAAAAGYLLLLRRRRRTKKKKQQQQQQQQQQERNNNKPREASSSARRAEADALVGVLMEPVAARQRAQRERGGLVIVSAKFGAVHGRRQRRERADEEEEEEEEEEGEIADVTVAVAALVDDDGRLVVPAGLRKSRLLGFWDPQPGRTKALVVRYLYGGREAVKEVRGREELRLP